MFLMMFGIVSTDAQTPFEGETGSVPKIVNRLNYGVLFVYEGQSIPIIDKWKYIFEIKLPTELFKNEQEFLESLNLFLISQQQPRPCVLPKLQKDPTIPTNPE